MGQLYDYVQKVVLLKGRLSFLDDFFKYDALEFVKKLEWKASLHHENINFDVCHVKVQSRNVFYKIKI